MINIQAIRKIILFEFINYDYNSHCCGRKNSLSGKVFVKKYIME